MDSRAVRTFNDSELREIAVRVAEVLRQHPGVDGGMSVRATLSFLDVSKGMRLLEGSVTLSSLYEAAFASYGSRLRAKGWRDPEEILKSVLDEVIFGKKVEDGLRLRPQAENESELQAIKDLLRDLMTLSVAHKYGPEIKDEPQTGVFPRDLTSLLREKYEEGKHSLPNLSRALMNAVRRSMKNGVFSPNKTAVDLLTSLEDFNLLKKNAVGEDTRYKFTKGSVTLVGENETKGILRGDYGDLVDNDSSSEVGESLSREELSKLLGELQLMLDLLRSGRLASSMEALIHLYGDQFPTIEETLKRLSPMTSNMQQKSWDMKFDNTEELSVLLKILERENYLENAEDLTLSAKAYELIFEDVLPEVDQAMEWGEHEAIRGTGGEGEVVDIRRYRGTDKFRDLSFGAIVRQLVKNRRRQPESADLKVNQRLPTKILGVILAIDSSRSMAPHGKLLYAKKAAVGLALAATRRGDQVGVLSFSDYARDVIDPAGNVDQTFIRRVADLRPLNSTNVEEALKLASRTLRSCKSGQKHVILITDGVPTSCTELFRSYQYPPYRYYYGGYFRGMSIKAAYDQAKRCLDEGVTISTICVERDEHVDREFCLRLSRLGRGRSYFLKDEREIPRTTLREYRRAKDA